MKKVLRYLRRVFSGLAFAISIIAAIWLFLCLVASVIHPSSFKYLAAFSLTTPFAILVNVIFFFFFLLSSNKVRVVVPVIALAASYQMIFAIWGFNFFQKTTIAKPQQTFRIMSWNVHGLGIYDRPRDKKRPEKMVELIKQYQPDILSLVEFYTLLEDGIEPHGQWFMDSLGYKEYRFSWDNTLGTKIFVGNAIFSKYPLSNFQTIDLAKYIKVMSCDVAIAPGVVMRGFFFHLQSFHLGETDKEFIESAKRNPNSVKTEKIKWLKYLNQFNHNYELRANEADSVRNIMNRSPYPVFICADLNDLPASYTYTTVKGTLTDAFSKKGKGLGRTYNMFSPTLRIDYIFYDDAQITQQDFQTIPTKLSDHNPVLATFSLK